MFFKASMKCFFYLLNVHLEGIRDNINKNCDAKFQFQVQVSHQEVFSRRLVVQAFFRIVINPIFDEFPFPKRHRGVHNRYVP